MRVVRASRGWRLLAIIAAVMLAAIAATVTVINTGGGEPTVGPPSWSDEFDGPAGSAPDPSRWDLDAGGTGWGNEELQYYTKSNAALDGLGHLVITAREENPAGSRCWYGPCRYTSARLLTVDRFTQTYGRFTARIKVPFGQGLLPAFWLMGNDVETNPWPDNGEIDIMENVGFQPSTVYGNLHGPGYSGANGIGAGYTLPYAARFADDFHTFTLDWTPNSISWYVDGQRYGHKTSSDLNGNRWVFDHPCYLLLNLAVGGVWPGDPDEGTTFPRQMIVDYVRVTPYSRSGSSPASADRTTA